ncbi:hypothetical protein Q3G72_007045 [Acer saccharum]|nr:hypothetical protein Q3G72_007045 [Acer saccharum]
MSPSPQLRAPNFLNKMVHFIKEEQTKLGPNARPKLQPKNTPANDKYLQDLIAYRRIFKTLEFD